MVDLELVHNLRQQGMGWQEVIEVVPNATDNTRKIYSGWLLGKYGNNQTDRLWLLDEDDKPSERRVGVIGDVHLPFEHPNYLEFCIETFINHKVTDIVFIGDLVDNHAISRHQTSTKALSPTQEFEMVMDKLEKWKITFPVAKFLIGNHDSIPSRQLATLGIPDFYLKDYQSLWQLPKTWEIDVEFIIDDVLYFHGINSSGKDGALNTAIFNRLSSVQGHSHSFLGCKYSANKRGILFGMNVGCGIDIDSYAMEYGKHYVKKPTLGCGVVYSKNEAYSIPMTKKHFRSGKTNETN